MSMGSVDEFLSVLCKNNVIDTSMTRFMQEWGDG